MTDEPTPRSMEIFFEVYEPLPRQGPGSRASAARALARVVEGPALASFEGLLRTERDRAVLEAALIALRDRRPAETGDATGALARSHADPSTRAWIGRWLAREDGEER